MQTNILAQPVLNMLNAFQRTAQSLGIDFYVVGAIARDIRLAAHPEMAPKRQTKEVDIALFVADETQFNQLKDSLILTGNGGGDARQQ